jgi:glycosyltransferase involved in cell wall biosynthesis
MKIAFIGQKGIPATSGGVERHVEALAVKLAEKDHEVFAYVRNNYTPRNIPEFRGVRLIHLPSIGTKHLDAISHTFIATIHAIFQNYDIVHYHAIGPSSLAFLIKLFRPRTTLLATFHCQDYFHQKWGWFARNYLRFSEFVTCRIPDRTIVVSKVLRNHVLRAYGKEATFISNGVKVRPAERSNHLKDWGLEKNGYILSVSRLIKHKGIHFLIEAYRNLEDRDLTGGKKLVIVGDGFHTDDYVNYLKILAVGSENIIFTGTQTGEALAQLFGNAFLFVQASEWEGLSISLLEAMAYGKAVLSSDIPENMEPLGGNGFYFRSGRVKDLERNLERLLQNPEILSEAGKNLQRVAKEEYDWGEIAEKTEHLYREVIFEKAERIAVSDEPYGKISRV